MRNLLPGYQGTVYLKTRQGPGFCQFDEHFQSFDQLPQFLPRIDWPTTPISTTHLRFDTSFESSNPEQTEAIHAQVDRRYGDLTPMPPFTTNDDFTYLAVHWKEHVAVLHEAFRDTIPHSKHISDDQLWSLITITSYGLWDQVTYIAAWQIHAAPTDSIPNSRGTRAARPNVPAVEEEWVDDFQQRMIKGDIGIGEYHVEGMKLHMVGRRYIVVPVSHGPNVWCMTIFDRRHGHLYIFDCIEEGREARVKAMVQLWARFWNFLRQPTHFQYFVPLTTPEPPRSNSSGLLCIMWLIENLRNCVVEEGIVPDDRNTNNDDFKIGPVDTSFQPTAPRLFLHDWVPTGCKTDREGIESVRYIIRAMIFNELGLENHVDFNKKYRQAGHQSSRELVQEFASLVRATSGSIPSPRYWTSLGGPQLARPRRVKVGPRHGPEVGRYRHPRRAGHFRLKYLAEELHMGPPEQSDMFRFVQIQPFTEEQPPVPLEDALCIEASSLDPDDNNHFQWDQYFRIGMTNHPTRDASQPVPGSIHLIMDHQQRFIAPDGTLCARFRLQVTSEDSFPVQQTTVTLPLPENPEENDVDTHDPPPPYTGA